MIKIEKDFSYGILAIVALVAIVAIFNPTSSTSDTTSSVEGEDLTGEAKAVMAKKMVAKSKILNSRTASPDMAVLEELVTINNINVDPLNLGIQIWIDPTDPSVACLHGSNGGIIPSPEQECNPYQNGNLRLLHFMFYCGTGGIDAEDCAGLLLTSLPLNIGELGYISLLDLHGHAINNLPESVVSFSDIASEIDLRDNALTSLPSYIGELHDIGIIDFSYNQITELPDEIGNMYRISHLQLQNNELTSLPETIGDINSGFTAGEVPNFKLYLANNQLESLPENIGNIPDLYYLNVENNKLTELPESLDNSNAYLRVKGNNLYCECIATVSGECFQNVALIPDWVVESTLHEDYELHITGLYQQDCLDVQ